MISWLIEVPCIILSDSILDMAKLLEGDRTRSDLVVVAGLNFESLPDMLVLDSREILPGLVDSIKVS